jgi:Reverse transcriptase (RNA-dependent DNA polymerase)
MERVVGRANLLAARARVKRNGGSPGMDGMTVEERPGYLKVHGPEIREALLSGTYQPPPGKRVEIPQPEGGVRKRGIPTVLDRFLQPALWQVLQPAWDGAFSDGSYGFRPGRSAHQAIAQAQRHLEAGYRWGVELDLEKFFDRGNHDQLRSRVKEQVRDRRVLQRIDRDRKAGALTGDGFEATPEGPPPGGPLTLPTKVQPFFFETDLSRAWRDPEDHVHLVRGEFHPLHQCADQLALPGPSEVVEPLVELRGELFQPAHHQPQCRVQRQRIGELVARHFDVRQAVAEPGQPRFNLMLFDKAFGVPVDQPRHTLAELPQLGLQGGPSVASSPSIWPQTALVFRRHPLGVGQQSADFAPYRQLEQIGPHLGLMTDAFPAKAIGVRAEAAVVCIGAELALTGTGAEAFPIGGIAAMPALPHTLQHLQRPAARWPGVALILPPLLLDGGEQRSLHERRHWRRSRVARMSAG